MRVKNEIAKLHSQLKSAHHEHVLIPEQPASVLIESTNKSKRARTEPESDSGNKVYGSDEKVRIFTIKKVNI